MLTSLRAWRARWSGFVLSLVGVIVLLTAVSARPALAIYPSQSTTLTGSAIGGIVPTGQATVNQCQLPEKFGTLTVQVQSVNLPDGTTLTVNYGGLTPGGGQNLGSFRLRGGAGRGSTNSGTMAGANDNIGIMEGASVILSNPGRWAASYTC
jgi:hypothetical protein